jgi:hypothetical protein
MRYLTQADLAAGLAKWQAILHLQDWEIAVSLVPQTTWDDRMQCADCATRRSYNAADIRLATFPTLDLVGAPTSEDMERTLVHELLHVVFRSGQLWDEKPSRHELNHYEHAIEATARALVELDRRDAYGPRYGVPRA